MNTLNRTRFASVAREAVAILLSTMLLLGSASVRAGSITLSIQNTEISEVMNMLAEKERVNILLANGIEANVSLNLYDVTLDEAIRTVARAGGFAVERHKGTYFIIKPEDAGARATSDITQVKTFRIRYSDPEMVKGIIEKHLSSYGNVTAMTERNMLVVEDTPDYLRQIAKILVEVDSQPRQVMIEGRILEVSLSDTDTYGINWAKLFNSNGGSGSFGVSGLPTPGSGMFLSLVTPNVELALDALEARDRLRTLSSPKLLALENQEASVVVGERQGYKVTTTINQVSTESIEFLESGVILRVLPRVDAAGRIMLEIHPEVSTGSVSPDGIPSQTTTEVTTRMLADDGQTIFIGGLIKNNVNETHDGMPRLGDIPVLGRLFSSRSRTSFNTETIVLITPYIVDGPAHRALIEQAARVQLQSGILGEEAGRIDRKFESATSSSPTGADR